MDPEASVCNPLERMLTDETAEPTNLPLSLLKSITNNFSADLQIGSGGFAVVYKGLLRNGIVAVKKLTQTFDMHETKFHQEVDSLMRVSHKNIVRFMGYCSDTQGKVWKLQGKNVMAEERQRFLCFEFLPEGSLDKYISDATKGLEWMTRYQIIKGICEGLHYLHQQKIVHLDLKPANILLDLYMVPKIADFGLSKCFSEKQTRAMTSNVFGSPGYMAPENYGGLITFKSDIYSLGVIIIELLTGEKGYPDIDNVLVSWSSSFKTSLGDIRLEPIKICTEIAIECTDSNPANRPNTGHITERLAEMERVYGFMKTDLFTSSATNAYLQSISKRLEERRLRQRDMDEWMRHHQLPTHLQERVRWFAQVKWLATRGGEEESILQALPADIRRDVQRHLCLDLVRRVRRFVEIKLLATQGVEEESILPASIPWDVQRHFCLDLVRRVPFFSEMDDQLLDAICERLVSFLCPENTYISCEGDPLNEMLFIIRGKLESSTNGGSSDFFNSIILRPGDLAGEELLAWALLPKTNINFPLSTRTLRSLTEVEAFALRAEDLKFVTNKILSLHNEKLKHTFRFYSIQWRTWAACFIQANWRRQQRWKLEKSLRKLEKSLSLRSVQL